MAEDFERIVRVYQDKIFRLAFSMLGDRAAAEETAQDVLVRVWKGLAGFREESSLSTWIYAITRNACRTALRRRGLPPDSLEEPAALRAVERRAAAAWLAGAPPDAAALLDRLPARYRTVVALFYMQEKSYDEVSRMLDLPVGTVKTYLFRARKSLAEHLARERLRKGEA
ncbi:MAG TPA: sigma-70 family RNA polymerase sigma factor [Bryobacteraceae bacterium]|nr:sigma-70 family RNA polymerase sigma factor [Bryobacteraceae bacterium]